LVDNQDDPSILDGHEAEMMYYIPQVLLENDELLNHSP
jgi:hypothetical protein